MESYPTQNHVCHATANGSVHKRKTQDFLDHLDILITPDTSLRDHHPPDGRGTSPHRMIQQPPLNLRKGVPPPLPHHQPLHRRSHHARFRIGHRRLHHGTSSSPLLFPISSSPFSRSLPFSVSLVSLLFTLWSLLFLIGRGDRRRERKRGGGGEGRGGKRGRREKTREERKVSFIVARRTNSKWDSFLCEIKNRNNLFLGGRRSSSILIKSNRRIRDSAFPPNLNNRIPPKLYR